jgi:hypothetical protein
VHPAYHTMRPRGRTQGVQGLPAMMDAGQFIVDNHQAQVISQSFGTTEEAFGGTQSLLNLRHAFISAAANGVTLVAIADQIACHGLGQRRDQISHRCPAAR